MQLNLVKLTSKRIRNMLPVQMQLDGIIAGGSPSQSKRQFDYITLASEGNATYFGDLTGRRTVALAAGVNSELEDCFMVGGYLSPGNSNAIDFVLFSSINRKCTRFW